MNLRYRVRYTRGKTEIIIESNDKAYIEQKLEELGATPVKASKRAAKKAQPARKRKVSAKVNAQTADVSRVLSAIRGATNSRDLQANVLEKRDRVGRILACYYFADRTGQGLTTRDVEALTDRLGNKIAQPNVGKVIRLGAKKFLSEDATTAGGGSVYKINQRGRAAFENLVKGQSLS